MTIDTIVDQAESLEAQYEAARERVQRGEAWLKAHKPTNAQYNQARALLKQRKDELAQAEAALDGKLTELVVKAKETMPPPSLNCVVCGKPVSGYPELKPGYYAHIECELKPGYYAHIECELKEWQ